MWRLKMTDAELSISDATLIARLRMVTGFIRFETGDRVAAAACLSEEAADRIEALIEESGRRLALARSEGVARVEQFERNEALTEQLSVARQDAKEAEAYAEELERAQKGWQETAVKLMNKLTISEAKLAKAVEALCYMVNHAEWREQNDGVFWDATNIARATLAEIKGDAP
jgi:hypothetical protein